MPDTLAVPFGGPINPLPTQSPTAQALQEVFPPHLRGCQPNSKAALAGYIPSPFTQCHGIPTLSGSVATQLHSTACLCPNMLMLKPSPSIWITRNVASRNNIWYQAISSVLESWNRWALIPACSISDGQTLKYICI